jgi:hypothetical protein
MMDSKTDKPVRKGQFVKGDPRINRNGPLNREAASYAELYKNALAKAISPAELVRILAKAVRAGRPWAIQLVHDDLAGKAAQPISGEISILHFDFGENGNGDEK